MKELQIVRAGLCSTVQDLGRFNLGRFGIIRSGVLDAFSARLANLLVGNPATAAVIESACISDTIQFPENSLFAITGGVVTPRLVTSEQQEIELPIGRPVWLPHGGTVRFGSIHFGWRTYLAVEGGLDVPTVLGSRSTFLRAGLGGWHGRSLVAGDQLPVGITGSLNRSIQVRLRGLRELAHHDSAWIAPRWKVQSTLPIDVGTVQIPLIPGESVALVSSYCDFTSADYIIRSESDRMGYRFAGPAIRLTHHVERSSEGLLPGTLQLPPDGQPILLLNDGAPTGGYPILGHVPQADLPQVAQLRPGQKVRWRWTTPEAALAKLFELESRLKRIANHLQIWLASPHR